MWREWKEVAMQHHISIQIFTRRVKSGWTAKRAATTPINRQKVKVWDLK